MTILEKGFELFKNEEYDMAYGIFLMEAAKRDATYVADPLIYLMLGLCHYKGLGTKQDREQASQ